MPTLFAFLLAGIAGAALPAQAGINSLLAMVIAGQLIVSVLLDHFGMFGFIKQTLDMHKAVGLLLMIAGVLLIKR